MKIHNEILEILNLYQKIGILVNKLSEKIDLFGIDFGTAKLVELSDKQIKSYKDDLNNDYLVEQHSDFEDCYYGHLYFATKEKNRFIKVYFEC